MGASEMGERLLLVDRVGLAEWKPGIEWHVVRKQRKASVQVSLVKGCAASDPAKRKGSRRHIVSVAARCGMNGLVQVMQTKALRTIVVDFVDTNAPAKYESAHRLEQTQTERGSVRVSASVVARHRASLFPPQVPHRGAP